MTDAEIAELERMMLGAPEDARRVGIVRALIAEVRRLETMRTAAIAMLRAYNEEGALGVLERGTVEQPTTDR